MIARQNFTLSPEGMEKVRAAWARNAAARAAEEAATAVELAEAKRANPFLAKSRNLTRQSILARHNPELAAQYKEEARLALIAGRA